MPWLDIRDSRLVCRIGITMYTNIRRTTWYFAPHFTFREPLPTLAIVFHRHMHVGGDCTTNPTVNANHVAMHIQKRTAAISTDECAIGHDQIVFHRQNTAHANDRFATVLIAAWMSEY